MCQMIFTSDQTFFDRIREEETKRYFDECYKFICNYKNLGEKNIISAVVHLDEGAPHMHLMFVPVVHTKDNLSLHKELSKQSKMVDEAEKYQKEKNSIIADNKTLNNKVKDLESEYKRKNNNLDFEYNNRKVELEKEFQDKEFDIEYKYKNKIKALEKENNHLLKIIDKFYEIVGKFIHWVCHKFGIGESKELIKDFQEETNTFIDPVKQLENEEMEIEWDLER